MIPPGLWAVRYPVYRMQCAPECALFVPYPSQTIGNEHARTRIKITIILYKAKQTQTVVSQLAHSFNQRARDSSSLERTKIPRRIVRFLVGFSFYTPFARSLHGFCTVRIFRVRWSKSVNYSAIRAIFFAIQVSKAKRSCAFTEGSASFRSSNSADTEMVGSASTGVACTSVAPGL